MMAEKPIAYIEQTAPLPDLLGLITTILERSSPPTRVSRTTLLRVIQRARNTEQALLNPQEYAAHAARILKDALAEQLTAGVRYERVDGWYDMTAFDDEVQSLKELIQTAGDDEEGKSLYDGVALDSGIEGGFLRELERRPDVVLYVKLPNWFRVDTPVGEYNPRLGDCHAQDGRAWRQRWRIAVSGARNQGHADTWRVARRRAAQTRCGQPAFQHGVARELQGSHRCYATT